MQRTKSTAILIAATIIVTSLSVSAETIKTDSVTLKPVKPNQSIITELQTKLEQAAQTAPALRAGEQINWWVISGGATNGSSTNYSLAGTVGQTAVGIGTSTNYKLSHGYWQDFSSAGCCDLAGDFNDDSSVDISDLTAMVDFMFGGGPAAPCQDEADVNGDNGVDISDLTYRVDFMFGGGPAPICGTTGS